MPNGQLWWFLVKDEFQLETCRSILLDNSWCWQTSVECISVVDPVTFQEFYKCWKQNEVHVRQVSTLNDFFDPSSTEVVVKVSQLISSNFGTGHIVLTHDRQVTNSQFYPV